MLVLALLTTFGACGNDDEAGPTTSTSAANTAGSPDVSSPVTGSVDGPVLTSPPRTSGETDEMGAEVKGVLVFDESTSCLLIELEDIRYPLVWPAGTAWQNEPPGVVLKSGEVVEPGMTVYGGGGHLRRDDVELLAGPAVADAAEKCAGQTGEIAFFNLESNLDIGR